MPDVAFLTSGAGDAEAVLPAVIDQEPAKTSAPVGEASAKVVSEQKGTDEGLTSGNSGEEDGMEAAA